MRGSSNSNGSIEQQLGLTELTVRMARYFDAEDDWLIEHKHPVDAFITRINTYDQPEPSAPPVHPYSELPPVSPRRTWSR